MRRKKKSGAGKMIAAVIVVVILLCGIFAIMRNLASPASADNKAGNKEGNSAKATEASTEAPECANDRFKSYSTGNNYSCWSDHAVKNQP